MAHFANEKLGCSFDVPDRPTVRQQLAWFGEVQEAQGKETFARYWEGAKTVMENWQCEALPDPQVSLDAMDNPSQARIVMWVGGVVMLHMAKLEDVPKN